MRSTYGKQLRHGYAILEVSETSYTVDYEELPLDCPDPHDAKNDLMRWSDPIFSSWVRDSKVSLYEIFRQS